MCALVTGVQTCALPIFLGNPLLESLQDHLVFLHDCHAADPLIVCDCLIIGSDEANNIFVAAFFQDFYADMPIKQPIAIPLPFYSDHNRRLDNANLADRRRNLPEFNRLWSVEHTSELQSLMRN